MDLYDYIAPLKNSILSLFVGDRIGSGASRDVYEVLTDPTVVLKVERTGGTFHNQTEYLVWQTVKNWPISDWFAPVVECDGYGNCILQKKTERFDNEQEFLAAVMSTRGGVVPGVFDDVHYANFGMLDGRVTCHDYGYHKFFEHTAREMSIEAGYITYDEKPIEEHDFTEGGQLALNL